MTSTPPEAASAIPLKRPLKILLAAPRGFCAGVDRAIQIVELALARFGAPVYVRHEIVHNKFVVDSLKSKGAVFVEELGEIPSTRQPVIFSAHGVATAVRDEAQKRNLFVLDATCPLVFKVHSEAERHFDSGLQILLIGHAGHQEVIGTMGQLPPGAVKLIETTDDALNVEVADPAKLAYVTQTTLSVDDTQEIVNALKQRFPAIVGPFKEDICYATTNRQTAVKAIAEKIDCLVVVGAPNSSNSLRLVEVAERNGCPNAFLIQRAEEVSWERIGDAKVIGITAGASAPDVLVNEVVEAFRSRYDVTIETVTTAEERIAFNVPRELRPLPAAS